MTCRLFWRDDIESIEKTVAALDAVPGDVKARGVAPSSLESMKAAKEWLYAVMEKVKRGEADADLIDDVLVQTKTVSGEGAPIGESPDCPRDTPCATEGFHAVDECTPRPTSPAGESGDVSKNAAEVNTSAEHVQSVDTLRFPLSIREGIGAHHIHDADGERVPFSKIIAALEAQGVDAEKVCFCGELSGRCPKHDDTKDEISTLGPVEVADMNRTIAGLRAQVDAMRAVVEAAEFWIDNDTTPAFGALSVAVDAYRKHKEKT
jgi:hypothetical protein